MLLTAVTAGSGAAGTGAEAGVGAGVKAGIGAGAGSEMRDGGYAGVDLGRGVRGGGCDFVVEHAGVRTGDGGGDGCQSAPMYVV